MGFTCGKIHSRLPPWRHSEPSEVGFGSVSSNHWVLNELNSDLKVFVLKNPRSFLLERTASCARPGGPVAEAGGI